ncbi:MAG: DUF177 domain-containing protein [Candidatus Omnitrophica bacterium]|nr:DUF177 domain-containing protein [Candidatus Omnitrophota bacterium]
MKIDINKIPVEGLSEEEDINPDELDLATQVVTFKEPISVSIFATKITNVVQVEVTLRARMQLVCSRCAEEFSKELLHKFRLSYLIEKNQLVIDLDPDIREELILNYPLNPLCRPDCKGLCPKCGKNLNEGNCNCTPII